VQRFWESITCRPSLECENEREPLWFPWSAEFALTTFGEALPVPRALGPQGLHADSLVGHPYFVLRFFPQASQIQSENPYAVPLQSGVARPESMPKTIIAIGSKRGPKINGVKQALEFVSPFFPPATEFELVGLEVDSGVSPTPLSHEELMRGARHRAETLVEIARKNGLEWHYFVGMEGGLEVIQEIATRLPTGRRSDLAQGSRRVLLESWAYVTDGARGHYGRSGGIELPAPLAHEVLENGTELAVAIDRFAGMVGIRDQQGAWGVLSGDVISRQEAFRLAVIAAFAPFYNRRMYRAETAGASGSTS